MPVFHADMHAIFIALTNVCHLQRFCQRFWLLIGNMLAIYTMPHVGVRFPLVLKFLLFFCTSLHFDFGSIVVCDLFSLTFILVITCTCLYVDLHLLTSSVRAHRK